MLGYKFSEKNERKLEIIKKVSDGALSKEQASQALDLTVNTINNNLKKYHKFGKMAYAQRDPDFKQPEFIPNTRCTFAPEIKCIKIPYNYEGSEHRQKLFDLYEMLDIYDYEYKHSDYLVKDIYE